MTIQLYDEKGNTSSLITPIQLASPVSDSIRMGQNYSLPEDSAVLGTSVGRASSGSSNNNLGADFKVAYPIEDSVIPVGNPLIKGVATPLSTITVLIYNSRDQVVLSKQTTADSQGN